MQIITLPFVNGASIVQLPPYSAGLDHFIAITEGPTPVRLIWTNLTDPSRLAMSPDSFSGQILSSPALSAATQMLVSHCSGRLQLVRFAFPGEWPAAAQQPFPQIAHGMTADDLAEQARSSPLPAGFNPQTGLGAL